jgi:hypothetical protein
VIVGSVVGLKLVPAEPRRAEHEPDIGATTG